MSKIERRAMGIEDALGVVESILKLRGDDVNIKYTPQKANMSGPIWILPSYDYTITAEVRTEDDK